MLDMPVLLRRSPPPLLPTGVGSRLRHAEWGGGRKGKKETYMTRAIEPEPPAHGARGHLAVPFLEEAHLRNTGAGKSSKTRQERRSNSGARGRCQGSWPRDIGVGGSGGNRGRAKRKGTKRGVCENLHLRSSYDPTSCAAPTRLSPLSPAVRSARPDWRVTRTPACGWWRARVARAGRDKNMWCFTERGRWGYPRFRFLFFLLLLFLLGDPQGPRLCRSLRAT